MLPILGPALFLLYISYYSCTFAIYADDTTLYSKCDQASDLWQQQLTSELESDLRETVDCGRKWLVDFNAGKTQLVSFDRFKNTGAIDVKMDGSVLEEQSYFKMLGLTFSSKLDWGSYIISIVKTACKKIGALIRSMKFLSPEVALFLYKSTIRPCMEYCCHVWAGAHNCYLELLYKVQKQDMQDCWSFTRCFNTGSRDWESSDLTTRPSYPSYFGYFWHTCQCTPIYQHYKHLSAGQK